MKAANSSSDQIARLFSRHVGRDWGMTNELVDYIAGRLCSHRYKGLYTPLQLQQSKKTRLLEKATKRPFTLICNVGRHFVCIFCTNQYLLYMDPFGKKCVQRQVRKFIHRLSRNVFYNHTPIQWITSNHCGLYAILFTLYFDRDRQDVRLQFEPASNNGRNDQLCNMYLQLLLNKDNVNV
jgi:hypothetical protein